MMVLLMTKKLRYLLFLALALVLVILVSEGLAVYRAVKPEPTATKTQEFTNTIAKLGQEEEFTIGKDDKIFYENTAGQLPKVTYQISVPGRVYGAKWQDLKIGDNVNLTITYDDRGQPKYRTLLIYRNQ